LSLLFLQQYTIDPIVPASFSVSAWYYQTAMTYYDNVFFLSNNGQYAQGIAVNQGSWAAVGCPSLVFLTLTFIFLTLSFIFLTLSFIFLMLSFIFLTLSFIFLTLSFIFLKLLSIFYLEE
jgi:hypothetical protein